MWCLSVCLCVCVCVCVFTRAVVLESDLGLESGLETFFYRLGLVLDSLVFGLGLVLDSTKVDLTTALVFTVCILTLCSKYTNINVLVVYLHNSITVVNFEYKTSLHQCF